MYIYHFESHVTTVVPYMFIIYTYHKYYIISIENQIRQYRWHFIR